MSTAAAAAATAAAVVARLRGSLEARTSDGVQDARDVLALTARFLLADAGAEASALAALEAHVSGVRAAEAEAEAEALRTQLVQTPLLVRPVQSLLLVHAAALSAGGGAAGGGAGEWDALLQAWFVPHPRAPEVGVWALRVLSQATTPDAAAVASVYARAFDLRTIFVPGHDGGGPAARAAWVDTIGLLTALPARMANLAHGVPDGLETSEFYARLTVQWESLLAPGRGQALAVLLLRFLKLGWVRTLDNGWWSTLVPLLLARLDGRGWEDTYRAAWHDVLTALGPYRSDIIQSLLVWIDHRSASTVTVTDTDTAQHAELAARQADEDVRVAHLLRLVLGPPPSSRSQLDRDRPPDAEGLDDDDESDEDEDEELDLALLFPPAGWSSAVLMRALVVWTSFSPGPGAVGRVLHGALAQWADANVRLASSLEQHVARASVLLLALSRLLYLSSDPAWRRDVRALLQRERSSGAFLDAVGAYLDHPAPIVRRVSLVPAEALVQALAQLDPTAATLDLRIWDGHGAGQELARTLRSLHWTDRAVRRGGALGFAPYSDEKRADVLPQLTDLSLGPRRARQAPKARQLGAGRKKKKPLIEMLEPEEGQAFSMLVPSSDSDGEDSSDGPEEDQGGKAEAGAGRAGISLGRAGAGAEMRERSTEFTHAEAAAKRDVLSSRMPKPRRKAVVYVHELPALLRGKRGDVRVGLHALPSLVRAKRGWGTEVQDSGLELLHALVQLDDHSLTGFERWLSTALVALLVSADSAVVQAAAELVFSPHLGLARKNVLLAALVYAALELQGTFAPLAEPGPDELAKLVSQHVHALVQQGLQRAKSDGEAHVPALQRHSSLLLARPTPTSLAAQRAGIRPAPPASWSTRGPDFLAPLLTRTLAHLALRGRGGYFTRAGPHQWPMGTLPPLLLPSLLEAIGALAPALPALCPGALETALAVSRASAALPPARTHAIRLAANEVFLLALGPAQDTELLGGVAAEAATLFEATPDPAATAIAAAVQLRLAELTRAWREADSLLALE